MESSSVVEDSEPERVRYRECFASTDLSDPPTSAIKNRSFGNWRHELERIDAGESLEPYWPSGAPSPTRGFSFPQRLRAAHLSNARIHAYSFCFSLIRI